MSKARCEIREEKLESGEASREEKGGRKTKEIVETRPSGHWPGLTEENE